MPGEDVPICSYNLRNPNQTKISISGGHSPGNFRYNKAKTKFHQITRRQYDSTERGQFFQGWIVLAILQNFVQFLIFFLAASTSLERSEAVKRDYCKYFQTSPCRKIFEKQKCWEIIRTSVEQQMKKCQPFLLVMFIFPPQIHIDCDVHISHSNTYW